MAVSAAMRAATAGAQTSGPASRPRDRKTPPRPGTGCGTTRKTPPGQRWHHHHRHTADPAGCTRLPAHWPGRPGQNGGGWQPVRRRSAARAVAARTGRPAPARRRAQHRHGQLRRPAPARDRLGRGQRVQVDALRAVANGQARQPAPAGHHGHATRGPGSSGRTCSGVAALSSTTRTRRPASSDRNNAACSSSSAGICRSGTPSARTGGPVPHPGSSPRGASARAGPDIAGRPGIVA